VKVLGPVHAYVAPATVLEVNNMVEPVHTGELLPAVGAAGIGFTTTVVVPGKLAHPPTVIVTLYVPDIATVELGLVGVLRVDVNEAGPVHAYVAPPTLGVDKLIVAPAQYGPVFVAVGVAGSAFTTTAVVAIALVQPPTVTVRLYVPAIANVAEGRVGSSNAEVNEAGPVHAYVAPAIVFDVKLMVCPTQSGELLPTVGVAGNAFTTIVIALDVAGLPTTPPKLEVMIHVTILPFANVVVVNVEDVAPPTFTPLICH
jgi:hypothetical protein